MNLYVKMLATNVNEHKKKLVTFLFCFSMLPNNANHYFARY